MITAIAFWTALLIVLYTFAGYAAAVAVLRHFRTLPVRRRDIAPPLSLVVPAYNEEAVIAAKIEDCLALEYPEKLLQILVVTDGSDDGTCGIASRYRGRGVEVLHQDARRGKAAAMNRAAAVATGEILVFSDANTFLAGDTLAKLVRSFADPGVGGVAGEKRVSAGGEGLYWRYESFLKTCDSALGSVMGAAGELFAVRASAYTLLEEDTILDDFVLSLRVVGKGLRVVYEPEACALEEPTSSLGADWERRCRNTAGGFQAMARLTFLLSPRFGITAWQYFSHRVLRWMITPLLLPLLVLLNILLLGAFPYDQLFLLQAGFYAMAALGLAGHLAGRKGNIFAPFFFFSFFNAAALGGLYRYLTGKQTASWKKVR